MKTLLGFCLYFALLTSVASLECYSCMNFGKTCENNVMETCDSNEMSCASILSEGSMGPTSMRISMKSCFESKICRSGYYSTSIAGTFHIHMNVSCCKTNKCNNMTMTLSKANERTPNRQRCPTCYSLFRDDCKARDSWVKCTHEEDHCFYRGVIFHNGTHTRKMAVRGCATKDVCSFKDGMVFANNRLFRGNITNAECYPAKQHSSHEP